MEQRRCRAGCLIGLLNDIFHHHNSIATLRQGIPGIGPLELIRSQRHGSGVRRAKGQAGIQRDPIHRAGVIVRRADVRVNRPGGNAMIAIHSFDRFGFCFQTRLFQTG